MAVTLATPVPVQGGVSAGSSQNTNGVPIAVTDSGGLARNATGGTAGQQNVQGSVTSGNPAADNGVPIAFRSSTNAQDASGNVEGQLFVSTEGQKRTYSIAGFITPAATATDILTLVWGASVMRLVRLQLTFTTTAAGAKTTGVSLIKRSAVDTTGTATNPTPVPHKSSDAAAATVINQYSVNPGALGASVGTIRANKIGIDTNNGVQTISWDFSDVNDGAPKLIAANENLAVNLGGDALLTGEKIAYSAIFTESAQ